LFRRALVIVNPIAGYGAGQRVFERVERGLRRRGISSQAAVTRHAGDARRAAAAQAADHDVVVVVGGDGTLNEVINGLEADRPVAVCPLGTGNVLAKELRVPRRTEGFCQMVEKGRLRALDVASAAGRRFVSFAGVGFDAEVAAEVAACRRGTTHITRYVRPILRCLARYRFPQLHVSIDGAEPVEAAGSVLVSNVRAYGGPFVVTPDALNDDGLLDVCVLRRGTRRSYLRAMLAFIFRCQRSLGGARYFRGRSIHVTADEPVRYQVDGDVAGILPATFELVGQRLQFVVP